MDTTATTPQDPGTPQSQAAPPAAPLVFDRHTVAPVLHQWLVLRRNAGATPADLTAELVAQGWDADQAARAALRSLRSNDRQSLLYAAATAAAGVAAATAGSSAHLIIAGNPRPLELTTMLTVCLVSAPIAAVSIAAIRRVERRSRFVLWSPSRRTWFGALALCTATVGIARLLSYLYLAIATITGASSKPFSVEAAAQVVTSLAIAIPLFAWSFREWRRSNLVISALAGDDDPDMVD